MSLSKAIKALNKHIAEYGNTDDLNPAGASALVTMCSELRQLLTYRADIAAMNQGCCTEDEIKVASEEPKDLTDEMWREYSVLGADEAFRIENPQKLWVGETTHRVLDSDGVVHCIPFPNGGLTAISWGPRDPSNPVQF